MTKVIHIFVLKIIFFFLKHLFIYVHVCVCLFCLHVHAWHPRRLEEGIRFPQTGVIDGCELSVDGGN